MADYVNSATLKASLSLTGYSFADADITLACTSASRAIDQAAGTQFFPTTATCYYEPVDYWSRSIEIDDLNAVTSVAVDTAGTGTYSQTWVQNTDYYLKPTNAALISEPFDELAILPTSGRNFPNYPRSVRIIGSFGWATAPYPVTQYAGILAAKLLRRARDAPFGIVSAGIDSGAAMRIARTDPDFDLLLAPYVKVQLFA